MGRFLQGRDLVALVLAIGVATSLVVETIAIATTSLSNEAAQLLSTLGGAMIGAIATYLGTTVSLSRQSDNE